ncbi:hypothetical protein PRZ48_005592 [Zasmidium cellare]|uniref:DNA polymerase eta n=1 Tax=Zasmidium cellare TaxID=395010 RepID=A0ABR0EL11_ZASCE|nr:hypothetical protein PRZ48_005592 [Zasmidium cellare]
MSSSQRFASSPISPTHRRPRRSKFTHKNLSTLAHYAPTSPLRVIAHIDLDAFYAQCEMVRLDIPADQPLAVQQWQGLIAINYPARAYGLSRHVTITEAKEKCPDIICQHVATWKEGDTKWGYSEEAWREIGTRKVSLDPYRIESRKILAVIKGALPGERQRVEKASIDEVFLDLSAQVHSVMLERFPELRGPPPYDDPTEFLPRPPTTALDWKADALVDLDASQSEEDDPDWDDIAMLIGSEIVRDVRKKVFEELKYTCSAGISKNKMLAKLGSGYRKPNSQTVIRNRAVGHFLSGFKFTKIRNLGGKLGDEVVAAFNTDSVGEMLAVPIEQLKKQLGDDTGSWLYSILRGEDNSEVNPRTQIKSMLSAKSFRPSINTMDVACKWLRIFVADIFGRLVEEGVLENKRRPKTINLHHRQGQQSRSKQIPIPMGKGITEEGLFELAKKLLAMVVVDGRAWPCSNLSLSVGGFEDGVKDNRGIGGFLVRGEEARSLQQTLSGGFVGGGGRGEPKRKKRRIKVGGISNFFGQRGKEGDEESMETMPADDEEGPGNGQGDDPIDEIHDDHDEDYGLAQDPDQDSTEQSTLPPSYQPQTDDIPSTPPAPQISRSPSEQPATVPEDTYPCPRCQQRIPQADKTEHDDFHFAQDLQNERGSPPPRPPPPKAPPPSTKNSKPKGRGRPPGGGGAGGGVEKGQRRTTTKREAKASSNDRDVPEAVRGPEPTQSGPMTGLSDPVEETALCFFMSNFAGGMTVPGSDGVVFAGHGTTRTRSSPYSTDALDDILKTSLEATSLACLANHARQQRLNDMAQGQYVKAINLTNKALSNGGVKKDSVLLSVNLLALFETISGLSKRSMKATADHVRGAAALLQLRGTEQFKTPLGRQAFLQTVHNLLISCLQWNIRLPEPIIQMTENFLKETQQPARRARLFIAVLDFTQFRFDVRRGGRVIRIENIIEGALQIDAAFSDFCDHPDELAQYDQFTDNSLPPKLVHDGHHHVYQQFDEARVWNCIRIFRITIHQLICESLLASAMLSKPEYELQFQQSTNICKDLAADLVASIPQQLGIVDDSGTYIHENNTTSLFAGSAPRPHLCGYPLLWPLWIAAAVPTATKSTRASCTGILDLIGFQMGIKHALVLAGLLRGMRNFTLAIWTDDRIDF